jgi:hypothetical protein
LFLRNGEIRGHCTLLMLLIINLVTKKESVYSI